jgi:predicted peptidase
MTRIFGWLACGGAVVLLIVAMVTGVVPAVAATGVARVTDAWVRLAAVSGLFHGDRWYGTG